MENKIISIKQYNKSTLLNKGKKAIYEDRLDDALEIMEKLYSIDPEDVNIIYNLAIIYIEKGENRKSEELLLKSYEKDKNHLFTLIGLANIVYYESEDLSKALKYLDIAYKNNQNSEELYISYGNLYMIEGQYDKSLDYYFKALKINKNSESIKSGLAMVYNFIGMDNIRKHQILLAMSKFKETIKYNEDWISPYLNLAMSFSYMNNDTKALKIISNLKDRVNNISIDYLLMNKELWKEEFAHSLLMIKFFESKILFRTAQKLEAKKNLKKILKINHKYPNVAYLLALIELENNNLEKADKYIRIELENSPHSIKVKTLRYIIYKKMDKASSWKNIHLNIIKRETSDVYVIYDSAMILKKFLFQKESNDLFLYAKSLNPAIYSKLESENYIDMLESIDSEKDSSS